MADLRLTRLGFGLMAEAIGGKQLTFTRVQFGDSLRDNAIVEPSKAEQFELTDLINPHPLELPITKIRPSQNGTCALTFLIDNTSLRAGFYARELGVFAKTDGGEMLYAYLNNGLDSDHIPPVDDESWQVQVTISIAIDNAAQVTAVLDTSLSYVTTPDFAEHILSDNPHPNIPKLGASITTAEYIWATAEDDNLHKISVDNLSRQILGDTTSLAQLNNRLNQAETNLGNIYMQLKSRDDLGLDANLLLATDFKDLDCVDAFRVKVNLAVEGTDEIELDTFEGLYAGACYQISDGIYAEEVQVKAVAVNGGKFVATLQEPLAETYTLADCYLYRTTVQIVNGVAHGAGDILSAVFDGCPSWAGTSANQTELLTLKTTQSNQAAFELEGDYAFTAGGEFTLA